MITPEDRREISKANKRIERMFKYTNGDEETIDKLRNDLEILYGHDIIGVPKLKLSEVSGENKDFLAELAKGYNASPYSTITSFKAMAVNGFNDFVLDKKLNATQTTKLAKLFRSPTWKKVREDYQHASEAETKSVLDAIKKGVSVKDITSALDDYLQSADNEKSALAFLDRLTK